MEVIVDEGVRESTRQRLGDDQVSDVAAGDQQGALGSEEAGQFCFELAVEGVVAGSQAGSGDVEPELAYAGLQCRYQAWVAGEAEIIATGEVRELAPTKAHAGAINLLKRLGLGHGGNL